MGEAKGQILPVSCHDYEGALQVNIPGLPCVLQNWGPDRTVHSDEICCAVLLAECHSLNQY